MSDIDFQNGFVCGMATKGLTRSGDMYEPTCWNDEGIYDYFYIDFRGTMEPFSQGMWDDSIIVWDSGRLPITAIELVSAGVYKLSCNISACFHGVNIMCKKSGILSFANGVLVPVFSTFFNVRGFDTYERLKYAYDWTYFSYRMEPIEGIIEVSPEESLDVEEIYESCDYTEPCVAAGFIVNEITPTVVLI